MADYAALRKQNKSTFTAVIALTLCVVLSACMLFSRLAAFSAMQRQLMIPLTESNGLTQVVATPRVQTQVPSVHKLAHREVVLLDETDAQPTPADMAWDGQTDLEIFRVSYENGEGNVIIQSGNGDKVIAPGASNEYVFTLQNTSGMSLDYTLKMEAYFSAGEKVIPVVVRMTDYEKKYIVGGPDQYEDVMKLNSVWVTNSLSVNYIASYYLEWMWPMDGDDAYDTLLGNMPEGEEVSLTIVIRTHAEQGGEGGEPPKTGDTEILIAASLMVASFAGLLVISLLPKRQREETHAE